MQTTSRSPDLCIRPILCIRFFRIRFFRNFFAHFSLRSLLPAITYLFDRNNALFIRSSLFPANCIHIRDQFLGEFRIFLLLPLDPAQEFLIGVVQFLFRELNVLYVIIRKECCRNSFFPLYKLFLQNLLKGFVIYFILCFQVIL